VNGHLKGALLGAGSAMLVICGVVTSAGCPPAASIADAGPPVSDCVARVIADAVAGDTIAQIVADVALPCALDAAQVIAILLGSSADNVHASPAYREALSLRMQDGGR